MDLHREKKGDQIQPSSLTGEGDHATKSEDGDADKGGWNTRKRRETHGQAAPSSVLRMTQLECHITEDDLHYFFSPISPVLGIKLVRDKFSSSPMSVAYIHFATPEDAQCALQNLRNEDLECQKRPFKLSYAQEKHKPKSGLQSKQASAAPQVAELSARNNSNPEEEGSGKEEGQMKSETNYIVDESTGLLYDTVSGYYFDSSTGLYGDPVSSQWFSYDHATGLYSLYAQHAKCSATTVQNTTHGGCCEETVVPAQGVNDSLDETKQDKKCATSNTSHAPEQHARLQYARKTSYAPGKGGSSQPRKRKYRDRAAERRAAVGSEAPG